MSQLSIHPARLLLVTDQNKVEEDLDPETQANKALFVLADCHTSMHLVLRINHLMRAEIEKDTIYKSKPVRNHLELFLIDHIALH